MDGIEIEKKYKITEEIYNEIIKFFDTEKIDASFEYQNDTYFSPLHFPFLGGEIDNECLRLRVINKKNILSYKKFIEATDKSPSHCIEHEMEVNDVCNLKLILKDLRIEEVFTLKKKRINYFYKNIEVSLDKVDNLGYFIELEIKNKSNTSEALKEMEILTKKFNISENLRNYEGYSYMLYKVESR